MNSLFCVLPQGMPCSGTHGSLTSLSEFQELVVLWPPLGSALFENPWLFVLLQGVSFPGTHCYVASLKKCLVQESRFHACLTSFKDCLFQELIVMWPPQRSALFGNPWLPGLFQGVPFSRTHYSLASLRVCLVWEPMDPYLSLGSAFSNNSQFLTLLQGAPKIFVKGPFFPSILKSKVHLFTVISSNFCNMFFTIRYFSLWVFDFCVCVLINKLIEHTIPSIPCPLQVYVQHWVVIKPCTNSCISQSSP